MKAFTTLFAASFLLPGFAFTAGCEREIASETTVETKSDGSMRKTEEKITEDADGTLRKTEKETRTDR